MPTDEITIEDLVNWYCEEHNIILWKDIPGYEGLYQVSNVGGMVRSVDRYVHHWKGGGQRLIKGKLIKTWTNNSGYKLVTLYVGSNKKHLLVHRLVAETFVPNPLNLPCINHIDESKTLNNAANLEWCDVSYNNCFGGRMERYGVTRGRPVLQYDLSGNLICEHLGLHQAARDTGISRWNIRNTCIGLHKTAGGYIWRYKE